MPRVVTVSPANSTVVASPTTIADDGVESSTITVTLFNTDGEPMPNRAVTLSLTSGSGTLTQPVGVTNQDGVITGSVVSVTNGSMVIAASTLGVEIGNTSVFAGSGGSGSVSAFTDISRDAASTAGGVAVTLTVADATGTPTVLFGSTAATSVVVVNPTTITCVVPAVSAGIVGVSCAGVPLVNPRASKIGGAFEFLPAPTTTFASDNFDDGVLTPFTASASSGFSVAATTTDPYAGTHSVETEGTAATGQAALYYQFSSPSNPMLDEANGLYMRWYLNVPQATLDAIDEALQQIKLHFVRRTVGSGQPGWLVIGCGTPFGGGVLTAVIDNGAKLITGGSTGITLGDNIWREIIVWMDRKSSIGTCKLWVDGKLQFTVQDADMGSDSSADIYRARCGITYQQDPSAATQVFVDEVFLANGFPTPVEP